jgi:hypothetical protein
MPRRWISPVVLATFAACVALAACGGDSEEDDDSGKPFAPQATLTAVGGTERTEKPELVMRVEAKAGDANIRSAAVTLPAAFIVDSTALGNLCSEGELEASRCRGRERMGSARVVSPAFGEPLSGPLYAVSGSGGLPRLAYVLGGPTDLLLRGRIEIEGVRIQAGIEDVPDTPLRTFELTIAGGKPGYLVLSRNICRTGATATASFTGHEGQSVEQQIPLQADCRS